MNSSDTTIDGDTTLSELAHLVCGALLDGGLDAVLSGGAAVSIYTDNKYQSYDLDFISSSPIEQIAAILNGIGFEQQGTRHFSHPENPFEIEFPGSVVMVGDAVISEYAQHTTDSGVLRLLTPTHSVMDRLAGYYHWQDTASLQQAVLIARSHIIDYQAIEAWSQAESAMAEYSEFIKHVAHEQNR